jgi:hypothetical protein
MTDYNMDVEIARIRREYEYEAADLRVKIATLAEEGRRKDKKIAELLYRIAELKVENKWLKEDNHV